ncbi:MAG TPA: mechanosensitive ion channel family protein [Candidatus Caccovicinus merdipullorum]|uniref:Mechanosensitive ion channel family protein n=1 Tax=Candidatus Caccovicinus merdipullorum TaxID=2840724 RepID=A0A9D1GKN4_9FIRM|nr:mechanosensitive ion channel family protein [Candidatus Caccovicinus merdipullorum]
MILSQAETQVESAAETAAEILQETLPVAQEVAEDISNLKPNAILETLKNMIPGLMSLGYRLLVVAFIIIIGMRIISSVKKMFSRSFERMEMEISLRKFLMSVLSVAMYLLLALIAADKLGFNPASLIAVVGSAGVAVALSLQESLSNFAGGIIIMVMKPFRVGDYIVTTTTGIEGTVKIIGLIYTSLLTPDNRMVVIPNGGLANSSITNVTAEDKRRIEIQVGISYESDLRRAKELLLQILDTHPMALHEEDRMPQVFVWELGSNSVVLGGRVWSKMEDYWTVKFEITEQIKLTFDREGIEIPYQRVDIKVAGLETGEKK